MRTGSGLTRSPDRVMLVGVEGIGKSTFFAGAPSPHFIRSEDNRIDCEWCEPENWLEFLSVLDRPDAIPEDRKTLVLDTVDGLDLMCQEHVCHTNYGGKRHGKGGFLDYGKGFEVCAAEWRRALGLIERLWIDRGLEIGLICHAKVKGFRNPTGEDYQRFEPILGGQGSAALIKGWCDTVLFARYQQVVREGKATSDGSRVMFTCWDAAHDAKNRWSLPPVLPLDYADYADARAAGAPADAEKLYAAAQEALANVNGHPKRELMVETIESNRGNAAKLAKILDRMRAIAQEQSHAV